MFHLRLYEFLSYVFSIILVHYVQKGIGKYYEKKKQNNSYTYIRYCGDYLCIKSCKLWI